MRPLLLFSLVALASAQSPFRLEKTVPLTGVEGRFDHLALDAAGKRLYIAALGNNTLEAVDLATGNRLPGVPGMHEPQGVGVVPEMHRVYVANGKDGKLRIFDGLLKPVAEVVFGEDADNVRYDAAHKQLWVGYKDGQLGALDPATNKRAGDIFLDAHPESFQIEKSGTRIFVNVPDAGEVEVVDRIKKTVAAKWPVKAAAANYPMALDEPDGRLFIGCRKPAKLLVLDMETGKVMSEITCPGDTDDVFYDAARKRIYVAGGEGFLEAFQQKSPDQYQSLGKIATAAGARTGVYSPELNRFYLAVPHRGGQGAEIRIYTVE
jgi:DNA-binding beta-propeller fold protein YncE